MNRSLEAWLTAGLTIGLLVGSTGCFRHIRLPEPSLDKDLAGLHDDLDILPPFPVPAPASGSLWTDAGPGMALVRDTRAFRLNDLVTIVLAENDAGTNSANTALTRESSADFGLTTAFGLETVDPAPGEFNLNNFLQATQSSDFNGDGTTTRGNSLNASITARVLRVLPNGDLVIGGQKTVVINREKQVLSLVGSIRSVDIDMSNRVPSTSVGDLTVRLWGRGEVDASLRQGWFIRALNMLWPF